MAVSFQVNWLADMSVTRVCFLSGDISRTGGTERVTTVIASALAAHGFDIQILSMANGETAGFALHPSVQLASLHMEGRSANFSDFAKWGALRRFVHARRIDVLVDVDIVLTWYSLLATWGLPVRVISWEHFHYFINVGDAGQRLRRFLARRLAVHCAHALVTLTERDRAQYQTQLDCTRPVISIPNPITIHPDQQAKLNAPVVLAAGRLVGEKGFDLLLQAWALVVDAETGWRLRIVGSGPNELALREQARRSGIEDSVEFVPHAADMAAHYVAVSIFVLSSRFEGFGLVLTEAKSFGLPVVSFDCACGPSDIVRNGLDGILVPKEDINALAAGIVELIQDPVRRSELGRNALLDRRFDVSSIVSLWNKLLIAPSLPNL